MGIKHTDVKASGDKGLASEWNKDHVIDGDVDFDGNAILNAFGIAPIGSVFAWLKTLAHTPVLPNGWVECNGQVLSDADSVYNGDTIPNLNGSNYFLRGNSTSGGTGGESTHTLTIAELPSHTHLVSGSWFKTAGGAVIVGGGAVAYSESTISPASVGSGTAHENKPPYYEVVWVMRVK